MALPAALIPLVLGGFLSRLGGGEKKPEVGPPMSLVGANAGQPMAYGSMTPPASPAAGPNADELIANIRRQNALSNLGQGLSRIGAIYRGQNPGPVQMDQFSPLQEVRLRSVLEQQQQARQQQQNEESYFQSLYHPPTQYAGMEGIGTTEPTQTPPIPEGVARILGAQQTAALLVKQSLEGPPERKTYEDKLGLERYRDTGELLPGETSPDKIPPELTPLMKEAAAMFPGDQAAQNDYIQSVRRKPLATITNQAPPPKIEPGYQLTPLEGGGWKAEAIPGSPAAQGQAAQEAAQAEQQAQKQQTGDVMLEDIDRAIKLVEGQSMIAPVTGLGGSIAEIIPGSRATNYNELARGIGARLTLENLSKLRKASPTGSSGLGPLSEREGIMLESALGSIANSQSDQQLLHNLRRLERLYVETVHGPQGADEIFKLRDLDDDQILDPNVISDVTPQFYEQELRRRGLL